MNDQDRSAVLVAVANAPILGLKVLLAFLRLKRAAHRARGPFYRELVRSGLPPDDARRLADEYASAVSVRKLIGAAQGFEDRDEE